MNKQLLILAAIASLAAGCSSSGKEAKEKMRTKEVMVEQLKQFEDSLKNNRLDQSSTLVAERYAEKCLGIYRMFPKSKEAPEYLDKAHVILSGIGLHRTAVLYADTLIEKYPGYKNRPMVLQSIASAYDLFIVPRRKELVEKYYRLLLKENPGMPAEERETIEFRLKHIDLTFEEMIQMEARKSSK